MDTLVQPSVPSLVEHTGSHKHSSGSKRSSLKSQNNQSSYPSPISTSTSAIPNVTLVLEPSNDTFQTKRIDLIEGIPVKIGRTTNKHTAPTEKNGYFDSKVLSRIHAEVWTENGKVYIKDLKSSNGTFVNGRRISAESKESEPVELNDYDVLEFGIDIINNDDRKLMFSKVTARAHISSNGDVSDGHSFKGESTYKRGSSRLFNSEDSIFATLESELHCARDENRRLVELSSVIGDVGKTIEVKSNKLYSDSNLALFQKIEETQAKFDAHLENCEIEKNVKQQKYQLHEKRATNNLNQAQSKNPEESQLTEAQAIHSDQVEKLSHQVTEMASQLEMTRGELEDMKLRHGSKIEVINQQIYDMVNKLSHEELERIRTSHESDIKMKMATKGNLDEMQPLPVNPSDSSQFNLNNPGEIQHVKVFTELSELKARCEKIATDQESLMTRINLEHASLVANKDNQISVLQDEKLDFVNQFAQFRKETLNALDTVKKQLSAAQETISLIANENEGLNGRLEKTLIENEGLKMENVEIKAEFELWRKEKQAEVEVYRNIKNTENPSVKGSMRFRALNHHKKQESTVKDSEWTDNEWNVGNVINDVTMASIEKADQKEYKKVFVKGTIGVVLVGFGAYLISKFYN